MHRTNSIPQLPFQFPIAFADTHEAFCLELLLWLSCISNFTHKGNKHKTRGYGSVIYP